jgi:hypothetical protein
MRHALFFVMTLRAAETVKPVGTHRVVGMLANPKKVVRLEITKPGVYEDFLVDAEITGCVLADNKIAFHVRGPGKRGGSHVVMKDCAVYDSQTSVPAEDKTEALKISGLALGKGVTQRIHFHGGKAVSDFESTGELDAPPMESLLKDGFPAR